MGGMADIFRQAYGDMPKAQTRLGRQFEAAPAEMKAATPMNYEAGLDLATNIPVAGDVLSGVLALRDAKNGDWGSAGMNALGVLPFLSAGMIKGTGKIADALNAKHGALDGYVLEGAKNINLSKVVVPKELRNQGAGTSFMNDLVAEADKAGKTVTLSPSSDFGGNKTRLVEFYKRFGFVPNKGKTANYEISEAMYRPHQAVSTREIDNYAGNHRPPMKDNGGAPLFDLTGRGAVYPSDIYSANAAQYYGTGDSALDRKTMRIIHSYKGNPDAPVVMYRAVPSGVADGSPINHGDWVTINPDYAKMHGESALNGDYKVLSQMVPARKLFTNGDSIHEFGYDQTGKINPALLAALGFGGVGAAASVPYLLGGDK